MFCNAFSSKFYNILGIIDYLKLVDYLLTYVLAYISEYIQY